MFSAYHVEQERWTLQQLQCDCGSRWTEIGPQQLMQLDGKPSDVYRATCDACGGETMVDFDVSSFFGRPSDLQALDDQDTARG